MIAGADCKLPYGNLPRLLLAWVCTEVVRTQTRLRNQMRRLFSATVQLVYKDERGETRVSSLVARRTEFWWNEHKPDQPVLWESKIELGEDLFNEIIHNPVPLDMNTLTALKRCSLGLDLYLWLT